MSGDPLRVYTDTSVFGGVFEQEFRFGSSSLLRMSRGTSVELVVSALVVEEIQGAPIHVREMFEVLLDYCKLVDVDLRATRLSKSYIDSEVLHSKHASDAMHVALASVNECNMIVSWNFRHIVNARLIPKFNAVNVLRGYNEIGIYTPLELIAYG